MKPFIAKNLVARFSTPRRVLTECPLLLRQNERLRPLAYLHPGVPRQAAGPFPLHLDFLRWRLYERALDFNDFDLRLVTGIIIIYEKKKIIS